MEKKIIKINNKDVTIMEQPTSTIIEWEKKYAGNPLEYAKQILKYPSDANLPITEIFDIPEELKALDIVKKYDDKEEFLRDCQRLTMAGANDFTMAGVEFIKMNGKDINDYKYKQVREIGEELKSQISFYLEVGMIIVTFREI